MYGNSDTQSQVSPQRGKVIDIRGRRAADIALDLIVTLDPSSDEFAQLAGEAVQLGSPLLTSIIRRLDASNPQHLEALGRLLAGYPSRPEVVSALIHTAFDKRSTDVRRVGAAMSLQHFLGVAPPPDFLATLHDPVRFAVDLLGGILDGKADSTSLAYDYLRVLVSQPTDLLHSVLDVLVGTGGARAVQMLRILALHPDRSLSHNALDALAADASDAAYRALIALEANLPPDLSPVASRALRKLRLSGSESERNLPKPLNEECRALLSPVDGNGNCLLWLLVPSSPAKENGNNKAAVLGLVLNVPEGLVEAAGVASAGNALPSGSGPVNKGLAHFASRLDADVMPLYNTVEEALYLEVPFLFGMGFLRDAVQVNWQRHAPLPVDYMLYCALFWQYGAGVATGANNVPRSDFSGVSPLAESESDLLFEPLFMGWYVESEGIRLVAEEVAALEGGLRDELTDENWRLLLPALIRLAHDDFGAELRQVYAQRLRLMSQWLHFAGRLREADLAASASYTMLHSPPEANLFVLRLIQRGVGVALTRMQARRGSKR